jgi:hypothetical protein
MKLTRLSVIVTIILIVFALGAVTYALIFDQQETESVILTGGEVSYVFTGGLTDITPVVPGQELVDNAFSLSNQSTITTELRILASAQSSLLGPMGFDLIMTTVFADGWVLEGDGYRYYRGVLADGLTEPGKYLIPPTPGMTIDVLSSLVLDGTVVRNNQSGQTITLSFTFEAKQAGFVTWAELGTVTMTVAL